MNIKQLRYFYEIANEGQITRAAKKLHIAQPPLSQALKALETNLGVLLFERNGRQMELTEAGEVLYEKAKTIFYKIDETIIEVKKLEKGYVVLFLSDAINRVFLIFQKKLTFISNSTHKLNFT